MKVGISKLGSEPVKFEFQEDARGLGLETEGVKFTSPVRILMEFNPSGDGFLGWARIEVCTRMDCARCLLDFSCLIRAEFNLLIEKQRPGLVVNPENEDTVIIGPQDKFVDIGDRVRQAIALSIPLRPLCTPDCKGLCHICGADLNMSPCSCTIEEYESRWEKLKEVMKRREE